MIRETRDGAMVCITATILDGLVLARSGTDHSLNYRSVMVLGRAHAIDDETEALAALEAFVEHVYPGRWAELRPATSAEIRQTTVLWTDLTEASAKIRADGPHDEPGDETWPTWAGVVPGQSRRRDAGAGRARSRRDGGAGSSSPGREADRPVGRGSPWMWHGRRRRRLSQHCGSRVPG